MVSYEEALKNAKELKKNINGCIETNEAYIFKDKTFDDTLGGDSPCIILKENGKAINMTEFAENYPYSHVREFDVE